MKKLTIIGLVLLVTAIAYAAPPARTPAQRAKDVLDAVKGEPVTNEIALRVVDGWCKTGDMPGYDTADNGAKARFFLDSLKAQMRHRMKIAEASDAVQTARQAAETKVDSEVPLDDPQ